MGHLAGEHRRRTAPHPATLTKPPFWGKTTVNHPDSKVNPVVRKASRRDRLLSPPDVGCAQRAVCGRGVGPCGAQRASSSAAPGARMAPRTPSTASKRAIAKLGSRLATRAADIGAGAFGADMERDQSFIRTDEAFIWINGGFPLSNGSLIWTNESFNWSVGATIWTNEAPNWLVQASIRTNEAPNWSIGALILSVGTPIWRNEPLRLPNGCRRSGVERNQHQPQQEQQIPDIAQINQLPAHAQPPRRLSGLVVKNQHCGFYSVSAAPEDRHP